VRAECRPKCKKAAGCYRCGQPGQQHGRRMPSFSSERTLSTCCRLVSSFLTEMVQQIHSLRASGVMSSQAASALASDMSASRRSAGSLCTTPPEIRMVVIERSRGLRDQTSDRRIQPGFWDSRRWPGLGGPARRGAPTLRHIENTEVIDSTKCWRCSRCRMCGSLAQFSTISPGRIQIVLRCRVVMA
jgi:hypothetical protein